MSAGHWSDVVQSPIRAFRGHSTVNKFFRFVHRQPTNHPLTGGGGGSILLNSFSDDPVHQPTIATWGHVQTYIHRLVDKER